ncbi:MAG: MBL fold metallo-hydrolase, partial [Phycisphaerae bacterium]
MNTCCRRLVAGLAGLLAALTVTVAVEAQNMEDVEITTHHVAGPVFMLTGRGGNIGVSAGDDGLLMIDDQFEPLAEKIRTALNQIKARTKAPEGLRFVLNTHWHGDHTGGNPIFGQEALLMAHENVRLRLSTEQIVRGEPRGPLPVTGWPVVTFEEGLHIHFNGERLDVVHYPSGHTDGDCVIYFPVSNVVHTGDLFFSGRFPYVDLEHGGDVEGLIKNVDEILERVKPDTKIIPGHGPLSTVEDLKEYRRVLTETTTYIRKRVRGNLELEEMKKRG